MRLCIGTDCEPVGRTIGPLQTVQPGLYPRANFYLEKRIPFVSKQSADYTAARDCTPKRIEKHPHTYPNNLQTTQPDLYPQTNFYLEKRTPYVSKQAADCTALDCTTKQTSTWKNASPKQSADCTAWDFTPSELLSRETHHHTYPNNANTKAIRSSLRRDTLRRVPSVREAKRKYKISQRRYQRIRKGERDVVAQHEGQDIDAEDNLRTFLECFHKAYHLPKTPQFGGVWPQHLWP